MASAPEMLEKYLARWAEPEARAFACDVPVYARVLLVPLFAETLDCLDGYVAAARAVSGRVLLILVVNAARESNEEARQQNARLLATLTARGRGQGPGLWHVELTDFDVLLVDRASLGREIPRKQGVGLARKLASDLALRLGAEGRLTSDVAFFTDADVILPASYFLALDAAPTADFAAALFPFRHVEAGDAPVHAATLRYELSLRYQVLGLAWAGSPYAFHSVGSTLAVPFQGYAAVRGVPKRAAGEDFYLLDKLAKVGPIRRLRAEPIAIRSRRSARVPFGTGPRVEQLLQGGTLAVAAPDAFTALKALLAGVDAFAAERDERVFERALAALPRGVREAAHGALHASELIGAARSALREVGSGDLRRRLHTWFDALATLRWLHRVRDAGVPEISLEMALEGAPFVALRAGATLDSGQARLIELEAALPERCGPSLP